MLMAQCEILLQAGTAEAALNQSLLSLSTDNKTRSVLIVSLSRDQEDQKTGIGRWLQIMPGYLVMT